MQLANSHDLFPDLFLQSRKEPNTDKRLLSELPFHKNLTRQLFNHFIHGTLLSKLLCYKNFLEETNIGEYSGVSQNYAYNVEVEVLDSGDAEIQFSITHIHVKNN